MEEIIHNLWLGKDDDYEQLDKRGWAILRACKEGPGGHRESVGYSSLGAPKGPDYLFVERGNRLALNLIDHASVEFIPEAIIVRAVDFITKNLDAGKRVLVACNHGRSRSASIVSLYLRKIGELGNSFPRSMSYMHKVYPPFDPNTGMLEYLKRHWDDKL